MLQQKLKSSAEADATSEEIVWFNETDRLLQSIVRVEEGRGRGHGQMVVMRVFAASAQRGMRDCLRNAVKMLGLDDGSPEHPLFSVMFDNGSDNTNLYDDIEEYFRREFNLNNHRTGPGRYTLKDRRNELNARRRPQNGLRRPPTTSLSYSDLQNVPMLLVLVDKGRTGDTFPHSLGYFDLRIRTAGESYATFEQELGRLCRYQTFRPINVGEATGCSHAKAIELGKKVSMPTGWDNIAKRRQGTKPFIPSAA